jgi:hypothetical protein
MLIVPEHNAIFIFPPRTGSTTLHYAIRDVCPLSILLYRHAERDAIPPGFEAFKVFGFVRHPLARMWSLYKFLCQLDPEKSATWAQGQVMTLLESVQGKTFETWLLHNEELFLPAMTGHPGLYQRHYMPETTKSQWHYLRPDLGTEILPFADLANWMQHLGIPATHLNKTTHRLAMPELTKNISKHLEAHMLWELEMNLECV